MFQDNQEFWKKAKWGKREEGKRGIREYGNTGIREYGNTGIREYGVFVVGGLRS